MQKKVILACFNRVLRSIGLVYTNFRFSIKTLLKFSHNQEENNLLVHIHFNLFKSTHKFPFSIKLRHETIYLLIVFFFARPTSSFETGRVQHRTTAINVNLQFENFTSISYGSIYYVGV